MNEVVTTVPTIGFNMKTVQNMTKKFKIWDSSGQEKLIDSNDSERLQNAKQELYELLKEKELKDLLLCVIANKQNLENVLTVKEIYHEFKDIPSTIEWCVFPVSAYKRQTL